MEALCAFAHNFAILKHRCLYLLVVALPLALASVASAQQQPHESNVPNQYGPVSRDTGPVVSVQELVHRKI